MGDVVCPEAAGGPGFAGVLRGWFEALEGSAFVATARGLLVAANEAATLMLDAAEVLRVEEGVLRAAVPGAQTALDEGLARSHPGVVVLHEPRSRTLWPLRMLPAGGHVLCRTAPLTGPVTDPTVDLSAAFGLTRAERRLLSQLLSERPIEEMAVVLGISAETVRTHRKRIFAKVGVSSRSELAGLVLRLAQ